MIDSDTVYQVKHYLDDLPSATQYGSYSLTLNKIPLDDFQVLGELDGVLENPVLELELVFTRYTMASAKEHVMRVREALGFFGDCETDGCRAYPVLHGGSTHFGLIRELASPVEDQRTASANFKINPTHLLTPVSTADLAAPSLPHLHRAVRAISLSKWNPPISPQRLKGDLFYIEVVSMEGKVFNITASYSGFYVNSTHEDKFDPEPRLINGKIAIKSHSLLTVIKDMTSSANAALRLNSAFFHNIDPIAFFKPTKSFVAFPWLIDTLVVESDLAQTQQFLVRENSRDEFDSEITEWTEKIELVRELKQRNFDGILVRESRWHSACFNFAEAATKGALSVIKGDIPSLNPEDPVKSRVFLFEGIFYSYCSDSTGKYFEDGGAPADRYAAGKEVVGVNFLNNLDIESLSVLATTVVDYCGRRILAQASIPGTFCHDQKGTSKIVYGGVDNRRAIFSDKLFEPLLEKFTQACLSKPHHVLDRQGRATELACSVDISGVLGSDGRNYLLDLHRITPIDLGFYDDCAKDGSMTQYPHRIGTFRTEAVQEWWRIKTRGLRAANIAAKRAELNSRAASQESQESQKTQNKGDPLSVCGRSGLASSSHIDLQESHEVSPSVAATSAPLSSIGNQWELDAEVVEMGLREFRLNPDVPLDLNTIPDVSLREEYQKDSEVIRDVSYHITSFWIPCMIAELRNGDLTLPLSGSQLTALMHLRGINLRYLGVLAKATLNEVGILSVLNKIITTEIIARSAKHGLNGLLAQLPIELAPQLIVHYFNCLLGYRYNTEFTLNLDPILVSEEDRLVLGKITVQSVRSTISFEAKSRFRYELPEEWIDNASLLSLFREISLKVGLQWRGRAYDFLNAITQGTIKKSGKKKKKNGSKGGGLPLFVLSDLMNIVPVIKYSTTRSQVAEETLEDGLSCIRQGESEKGVGLLTESLALHEHVYGLIHEQTINVYSQIAMAHYSRKNFQAACEYGRKTVLLHERCTGVDSYQTIMVYFNLALFEHENGNTAGALKLMRHAFEICASVYVPGHPCYIPAATNVACMLKSLGLYGMSIPWYVEARNLLLELYGRMCSTFAATNYQMAFSQAAIADYRGAIESMDAAQDYFVKVGGIEDEQVKETQMMLDKLRSAAMVYEQEKSRPSSVASPPSRTVGSMLPGDIGSNMSGGMIYEGGLFRQLEKALAKTSAASFSLRPARNAKGIKMPVKYGTLDAKSISELVDFVNGVGINSDTIKEPTKGTKNTKAKK